MATGTSSARAQVIGAPLSWPVACVEDFTPPPRAWPIGRIYLNRSYFIFWATGGPIGILSGDHIDTRHRMMKSCINHTGWNPLGDLGAQSCTANAAGERNHSTIFDAAKFCIAWMDFQQILWVPY